MNGFNTGFVPPAGFPGFPNFGNHPVQMPAGWVGGAPIMPDDNGMHQAGPIRRGGGRFQNQRSGPYDRRQPRYAGNNGRLSPPRGMMGGMPMNMMQMGRMATGGGKWGDGAGAQTVGPREAVQGRSLKSYEDLDAVGGAAGGELNY